LSQFKVSLSTLEFYFFRGLPLAGGIQGPLVGCPF